MRKTPQTEVEWKKVNHFFARGNMAYGRGLTAKDAIATARTFMPSYPAENRKAAAFDVWRVPAGETLTIDQMGTVSWSDGCERMQTAKVKGVNRG
jgi:hypothetical protein